MYSFFPYTGGSSAGQDGQRLAGLSSKRSFQRTVLRQVELIIWPQSCDIILVQGKEKEMQDSLILATGTQGVLSNGEKT